MDDFEAPATGRGGSAAGAIVRGLIAAVLVFGIYWLVFEQGDDDLMAGALDTPEAPTAATTPAVPPPTPAAGDTAAPTTPGTDAAAPPTGTPGARIGEGYTIQVLRGADTDQAALDAAVAAVEALGFEVVSTGPAARPYPETTVFATAGFEEQAQQLVDADPRFTVFGENPGTVSADINLHVVVGTDWPLDGGAGTEAAATEGA